MYIFIYPRDLYLTPTNVGYPYNKTPKLSLITYSFFPDVRIFIKGHSLKQVSSFVNILLTSVKG